MNTWFRRTVGTVGIAGGMLLLGAGAAHADDTALAPGQLDDLFSPAGGPNNQSLQLQAHSDRIDTSAALTAENGQHATSTALSTDRLIGRQMPGVLDGLPLSGLVPTDSLSGMSIADTSTAFPAAPKPSPRPARAAAESLPLIGGLPLLGNGLPVHGTLNPVDDYAIPLGAPATEANGLPLVGDLPLGGSDVLKNDSVTGIPVIGGIGPTPGVSTTAVANRLVPTTGALPQAASQLPLLTEKAYAPKHSTAYSPRHAQEEALPLVTGLPAVGGLAGGVLPLFSGIVG
ncbi:hypothetical protein ABT297_16895 [Dactylosporangium sp. NPDC000555]|uniref:hypothetical protein n=1 Tax=Dactylosporangium sp. NPDC000555 TaxID=3154260 RepID=UPI00331C5E02